MKNVATAVFALGLSVNSLVQAQPPRFLEAPFRESNVKLQQAPLYLDGSEHLGGGLALDYILGDLDDSSTWTTFDVVAAADGVAIQSFEKGFGPFVLIRHKAVDEDSRHFYTLYAHLVPELIDSDIPSRSRYNEDFDQWKRVKQGDFLGKTGSEGTVRCLDPSCIHLHFEVFRGGYFRDPIDPYDLSSLSLLKKRSEYPPLASECGPNHLWTSCPPEPKTSGFWIRTNGPDLTQSTAVVSLAVNSSGDVYAPTNQGCVSNSTLGVLRTFDKGDTWTAVNDGLGSTNITALTVAPDDTIFVATDAGVFSLRDGEDRWRATGLATGPLGLTDMVVTPLTVLASSGCGCTGVYRSTDGGTFWRTSNGGILAGHLCVQSMATDALGTRIYGGTGTNGVYRSTNQGASWQRLTAGQPPHKVREVTVSPSGDVFAATLSLGVFRYPADDTGWISASNGLPDVRVESISAAPSGVLLAGAVGLGIFVSNDNGETWTELNAGIDPDDLRFTVGAFAFDPDGFAYAAVGSVVYRSAVSVTPVALHQ